ncbi:hypothetical protein EDB19DRAFT_1911708 [Suillus lakei]|nr:hypothetical protein EDB19DRAFT_1911708 [Suillus lakei]
MSSSTFDLIPQLNLGNTFGTLFIGVVLEAMGTGITLYNLSVIWLWTLNALHLALNVHFVYYYLVTNYANFGALTKIVWSLKLQVIVNILIVPVVHLLYVHRIWIFSKDRTRVLPAIALVIIVVLCTGVAIPMAWVIYKCQSFSDLIGIEWWIYAAVGASTFIDIIIASSLCYLFATSHTEFSRTDSFLTKLVGYTLSAGCLTSACSIIVVITCVVLPKAFVFLAIEFLVAQLYVNSFIALLNARYYVHGNADIVDPSGFHVRHSIYRPELQASRKDPEDGVLHITHPIQAVVSQPPTGSLSR